MRKLSILTRIVLVAALLSCTSTGCTKEARRNRLLGKAESDFKAGAYDKAKIEYLNVLRLGGQNPTAFARLGQIWLEQGVPLKAGAFLVKAKELAPNDLENRLRLAQVYNAVGKREDAKKEALFVLQHSPANEEALLLLAQTAFTPEEISSAEQTISTFPKKESVSYYLAQGSLAMHKIDAAAAQPLIEKALAIDPKSAEAHRSRAILFLLQKDPKGAGAEFKRAAELSPPRSSMKITYADYLTRTGATAEATAYLRTITSTTPDFLPAWTLLARTALSEKKPDEALTLLENVSSRDPDNVDARLLQADAFLGKRQTKKAVDVLESLARSYPNAAGIKFHLARAYLQDDRMEPASAALSQAITANPNYDEAILLLAELKMRTGQAAEAIGPLEKLAKKKGDVSRVQTLLADAYRGVGRLDEAAAIFRQQIAQSPNNADAYLFLGLIQEQQKKPEDARLSFEKSLELAPEKLLALSKLVDLDLTAKDFDKAMERVQRQLQKSPNAGSSYLLQGKVLAAKKEWTEAEAALKKAIELDPNLASAYDLLVGIYLTTGKTAQAIQELEAVLVKSPKNKGALMTLASIEEKQGNYEKVRDAYERLVVVDPNDVTALNNLAFVYAERLNQLDKSLELARKARSLAPANPAVADTLGWVLFKRDDYQQAVPLLEEAANKISDNPDVRFHLGMAHYMMGQPDAARADFEQALSMGKDFPGKQEAQRRLDLLSQTAGGSSALTAEQLENMLKEHPKDLIARLRLAEAYEAKSSFAQAAGAYEEALKLNPKLASATLHLAQLYAGPLSNPQKALDFAKKARDLAPSDPQAAGILGGIAFDAGNLQWAYSLLQESSRQSSANAKVLHDLAWAAYSLGKVDEARQAMERCLNAAPGPEIAADGKSFLMMTGAELDPAALTAAKPEVEQKLKKDPKYVPALMAAAVLDIQAGRTKEAEGRYQDALQRFPDFAPAQKQLAIIYAKDPARTAEAYALAVKARKNLPDDAGVARLLGQLSFETKEYSRARQLLQESAKKNPLDAEGLYYLGLSCKELGQLGEARKSLTDALAAGLPQPLADSAQRTLAELKKQ